MRIIAGQWKGRSLFSLKGHKTRPSSEQLREALFNICQPWIEGSRFLDLFAGTGAIGLEAISRGAREAVFIEKERPAFHCLKRNIAALQAENQANARHQDALIFLEQASSNLNFGVSRFDLIFIDPPYEAVHRATALLLSEHAAKRIIERDLLAENGLLIIESGVKINLELPIYRERRFGDSHLAIFKKFV